MDRGDDDVKLGDPRSAARIHPRVGIARAEPVKLGVAACENGSLFQEIKSSVLTRCVVPKTSRLLPPLLRIPLCLELGAPAGATSLDMLPSQVAKARLGTLPLVQHLPRVIQRVSALLVLPTGSTTQWKAHA